MYRAIPVGSKLLQRKWDQQNRDIHIGKLREAKPSVDVREPAQFKHIKKKLKKNQLLEGKHIGDYSIYRALYGDRKREPHIIGEDDSHNANNNRHEWVSAWAEWGTCC